MTFSKKSETLKPRDAYLLHPNFWGALYITCCGLTSSAPIIDCSGAWLIPFVAALTLGVPYINLEYIANQFAALKTANFTPVVGLVSNNASTEEVKNFLSTFKKFKYRHVKEADKKAIGKNSNFIVTFLRAKGSISFKKEI
jgi:hypothetical protein